MSFIWGFIWGDLVLDFFRIGLWRRYRFFWGVGNGIGYLRFVVGGFDGLLVVDIMLYILFL